MRVLQVASESLSTRYFHTDHLGSISVITDNGLVVERLSYDAWGKRRFPDGSDDTTGSITSQTTRGFTGQEQLSVSGLVHLNGRGGACPRAGVAGPRGTRCWRASPLRTPWWKAPTTLRAGTATPMSATTRSPSPIRRAAASSAASGMPWARRSRVPGTASPTSSPTTRSFARSCRSRSTSRSP